MASRCLQPDGSLSCYGYCPDIRQNPHLEVCTQNQSPYECACGSGGDVGDFSPCSSRDLFPTACIWLAGGGASSGNVEIMLNLPRGVKPSLSTMPGFQSSVRSCGNRHAPLVWKEAGGKAEGLAEPAAADWQVLVSTETQVILAGPWISDKVGKADWSKQVLDDPEGTVAAFGSCVVDATEQALHQWSASLLQQMNGMKSP